MQQFKHWVTISSIKIQNHWRVSTVPNWLALLWVYLIKIQKLGQIFMKSIKDWKKGNSRKLTIKYRFSTLSRFWWWRLIGNYLKTWKNHWRSQIYQFKFNRKKISILNLMTKIQKEEFEFRMLRLGIILYFCLKRIKKWVLVVKGAFLPWLSQMDFQGRSKIFHIPQPKRRWEILPGTTSLYRLIRHTWWREEKDAHLFDL